jgi:hypothetical protein
MVIRFQVIGPLELEAGDRIVKRATDELREGTVLQAPAK